MRKKSLISLTVGALLSAGLVGATATPAQAVSCTSWVGTNGSYSQFHVQCPSQYYIKVKVQCADGYSVTSAVRSGGYQHADCYYPTHGGADAGWAWTSNSSSGPWTAASI
ncbi:hypothetical protein OG589_37435 [Sphaerisporangium sp. NBC_01403]|uniref:hypothetical protein n=1 Tax=Sphaerisporangium sp. NBC_01403 TaxID=2903599 RepID=UPI0032512242